MRTNIRMIYSFGSSYKEKDGVYKGRICRSQLQLIWTRKGVRNWLGGGHNAVFERLKKDEIDLQCCHKDGRNPFEMADWLALTLSPLLLYQNFHLELRQLRNIQKIVIFPCNEQWRTRKGLCVSYFNRCYFFQCICVNLQEPCIEAINNNL